MFVILDTDHFSEFTRQSTAGRRLNVRLMEENADVFVTIVTAHEAVAGWFSVINRYPAGERQVSGYMQLGQCLQTLSKLDPIGFDSAAAAAFGQLRQLLPRLGSMDLKIAAICLTHDALLLTRNTRDFENVPGLRMADWLE